MPVRIRQRHLPEAQLGRFLRERRGDGRRRRERGRIPRGDRLRRGLHGVVRSAGAISRRDRSRTGCAASARPPATRHIARPRFHVTPRTATWRRTTSHIPDTPAPHPHSGHQRTRLSNRNAYAQHRSGPKRALDTPSSTHASPICKLLGGFAGRISPKRHPAPMFPQFGGADSEQPPPKTAQKPRTRGEIGAHFLRNRPEPARAPAGKAAAAVSADAGAAPYIAANAPPSPVQKRFEQRQRPRPLCRPRGPAVLTFSRFKPPSRHCTKERTAADAHTGMHIGLICACNRTNTCTGCTTNHHAKALMENARRTTYPPLQKATPIHPHQTAKKVTYNYLKLLC